MAIKLSVIIPSYNRYPFNLWALTALENQTVHPHEVEIIVIDDCSTDETFKLQSYESKFKFTYIRNEENKGRSFSRNAGIEKAQGEILLFLDAEMLTEPDFLQNHMNHHHGQKNLVICGALHSRSVYTLYDPTFTRQQIMHVKQLAKENSRDLPAFQKEKTPLITVDDIQTLAFKELSYPNPYFPEIVRAFGDELKDYQLPWNAFVTCNVSVKKDLLKKTGGFDESFKGWGYEDWEIGYRLFQKGARFISNKNVTAYHQDHPVSPFYIENEMLPNFYLFQKKHRKFEICLHVLFLQNVISRVDEHVIVKEYNDLRTEYPEKFQRFREFLVDGLDAITSSWVTGTTKMKRNNSERDILKKESEEIRRLQKYNNLLKVFQIVSKRFRLKI